MTSLEKRLLGLMQMDAYLCGHDGHIWIVCNDNGYSERHSLDKILRSGRVGLNNKIYRGVLEALDTIDESLNKASFCFSLEEYYSEVEQFMGSGGVDYSRISANESEGGLY